jgi:hypothetical protein
MLKAIGVSMMTWGGLSLAEAMFGRPSAFAIGLILIGLVIATWPSTKNT